MSKSKKSVLLLIIAILVLSAWMVYGASDASTIINSGEVLEKDQFFANETIRNGGTIKGDTFALGEDVASAGTIEGDFIGVASNINMSGNVRGDMRVAAGKIIVNGSVGKNVNILSGDAQIKKSSQLGGSLIAYAGNISVEGTVKGDTHINAGNITLSGEFFGDVDVNTQYMGEDNAENSRLTILPDTIIHGKLSYGEVKQVDIPVDARINEVEKLKQQTRQEGNKPDILLNFIKLLFTTAVYFLVALIACRLFPGTFKRQSELIRSKPLKVMGLGFIGLVSVLVVIIILVILLMASILVISPSVTMVFGSTAAVSYMLLVYFSSVPVAMWLGDMVLRGKLKVQYRFAIGLAIIQLVMFALSTIAGIMPAGPIFAILEFAASFVIVVIGSGTLLHLAADMIRAVRRIEKAEVEGTLG